MKVGTDLFGKVAVVDRNLHVHLFVRRYLALELRAVSTVVVKFPGIAVNDALLTNAVYKLESH
ncbi:hypothetical protein DV706_14160 [Natronorubrum bangense]|uniref:Uncharacterized protein n=2 Tax=Natronorubrum bangense TaxID=61858 RepID=L9WKB6_9EURY|nr:hypothetical protein C494_07785 [Natronorubrum bangense JCM 10635]QCC55512.1 hypothetical protein DV706_14160 [Natronorubrum bangense]